MYIPGFKGFVRSQQVREVQKEETCECMDNNEQSKSRELVTHFDFHGICIFIQK